jgi:hypothetical protein
LPKLYAASSDDGKLSHVTEDPDDMLQTFLAGRDSECPVCRYNLRDLQTQQCPECGSRLALQVGAVEPNQTACIVGLIGLASGAGFSGLLVIYLFIRMLIDPFRGFFHRFAYLTAIPFLIEASLLIVWLRNWRKIRRLPTETKWLMALGCCALSLINLLIFALSIR